jgi:SAM-dependent methyltransferase
MRFPVPEGPASAATGEAEGPAASSYDEIAEMYHLLWANWYLPAALPALESLFFRQVKAGSRVLDLCCGSGHVTQELVKRGYRVTGVDASAALIAIARREMPEADWRVQDARRLEMSERFDGVLSTFDSLNHILSLEELRAAFRGVCGVLKRRAPFVFDMNLEEAYTMDLRRWTVEMADDSVGLVRGTYDFATKLASTELVWFAKTENDLWRQQKSVVEQRCYPQAEIMRALKDAGFGEVKAIPARDAGVETEMNMGRVFFVARV